MEPTSLTRTCPFCTSITAWLRLAFASVNGTVLSGLRPKVTGVSPVIGIRRPSGNCTSAADPPTGAVLSIAFGSPLPSGTAPVRPLKYALVLQRLEGGLVGLEGLKAHLLQLPQRWILNGGSVGVHLLHAS